MYLSSVTTDAATDSLSLNTDTLQSNTDSEAGHNTIAKFLNVNKVLISWIDSDDNRIVSRIFNADTDSFDGVPFYIDDVGRDRPLGYGIASASLSNGNVVVTWDDNRYTSGVRNIANVRACIIDSSGTIVKSEYNIRKLTGAVSGLQLYPYPVVASVDSGYYMIAWYDGSATDGDVVKGKIYTNDGTVETNVFDVVNSRNLGHTAYPQYRLRLIGSELTGWNEDLFIIKYVCDTEAFDSCIAIYDKDGTIRTVEFSTSCLFLFSFF